MDEKREEEEKEETPEGVDETPTKENKSRELYWVVGVMAALVIIFFAASTIFQGYGSFEYEGLSFKKEFLGEIPYYRYTYNSRITPRAVEARTVNLVLRTDPRELSIPIEGEIEFPYGTQVYITTNSTNIIECPYAVLAASTLSSYISSNGFSVKGAVVNAKEAEENELLHITCDTYPGAPTILIQSGEETKITRTQDRCYVIEVANCEILPAVEKFMVQSLIDARTRAGL